MKVKIYKKKPVMVKVLHYLGEKTLSDVRDFFGSKKDELLLYDLHTNRYSVKNSRYTTKLENGDYIVYDDGEFYVCKPEEFKEKFKVY